MIPVPKPRGIDLNEADLYISGRKERRHILQKEKKREEKSENKFFAKIGLFFFIVIQSLDPDLEPVIWIWS